MPTLYGPDGQPIRKQDLTEEKAGPTTTGIRSIVSGHPWQGLTPTRLANLLRDAENGDATRYLKLAEEMEEKDLHYRGMLGTRWLQVSQLEITVEAADDSPEAQRHAEWVEQWLGRECLEEEIFELLDAIGKGYSVLEILWDTSEGQWMPARLVWREPRWFAFDREDGHTLMLWGDGGQIEPLAPYKFVVHLHKTKSGLPIRGGLARAAAWSMLFKNFDVKGWVAFAEVFGQPLRLGKYHPGASEEDKATLLRAVANIGRDAAAIIPESMMIEFVEAKVSGNIDLFEKLAKFMDMQVSKAVLGQTTTTDAVSGGHAVSKEHNEVREDIERFDAHQAAGAIDAQIIQPGVALNFGPQKRYPRVKIGRPEEVDVPEVIKGISTLVPLGLKVRQKWTRDTLGVPDPEDDEELLSAQTAAPPTGDEDGGEATPPPKDDDEGDEAAKATAAEERGNRPRDALDTLAEGLDDNAAPAMDALIDQIRALIDGGESLEDVQERLLALHADLDPEELADAIREGLVVADLIGRADAL